MKTLKDQKAGKVAKAKTVGKAKDFAKKPLEGFKDGYSSKQFGNSKEALELKMKRETKASILLTFCLDRINKGQKEISVTCKDLFKEAKSERIKGSSYADKRFPSYILKLAGAESKYFVRDKIIKEVTKDGNSGGVVPEGLLGFKFIMKDVKAV